MLGRRYFMSAPQAGYIPKPTKGTKRGTKKGTKKK